METRNITVSLLVHNVTIVNQQEKLLRLVNWNSLMSKVSLDLMHHIDISLKMKMVH
jgi:hypothetical protein